MKGGSSAAIVLAGLSVALLCCLFFASFVSAEQVVKLGTEDLPDSSLDLTSTSYTTEVEVVVDSDIEKPQLDVGLSQRSDNVKKTEDIVKKKEGGKMEIDTDESKDKKDKNESSGGFALSRSWIVLALCSVVGLLLLKNRESHLLTLAVVLVALYATSTIITEVNSNEEARGSLTVYITIRVPHKWWFPKGLTVTLRNGNLKIFGKPSFEIERLTANFCQSKAKRGTTSIQIKGVSITGRLDLCADEVSLDRILEGKTMESIDVTAHKKAYVAFSEKGFFGSYSLNSPKTSLYNNYGCATTEKSSVAVGQCGSVSKPTLRVSSSQRIYVDLNWKGSSSTTKGSSSGTSTGSSTGSSTGTTSGSASPSMSPSIACTTPYSPPQFSSSAVSNSWTIPGEDTDISVLNNNWRPSLFYYDPALPSNVLFLSQTVSTTIDVALGTGWGVQNQIILRHNDTTVKGGFPYKVSFGISQAVTNLWTDNNDTLSKNIIVHVGLFAGTTPQNVWSWGGAYNEDPSDVCKYGTCTMLYNERLNSGLLPATVITPLETGIFSIPSTEEAQVVIWIVADGTSKFKPVRFSVSNIKVHRLDKIRNWPTPATKAAQTVNIPRPPTPAALPPSQSDCPHWENGLLDWHNPASWPDNTVPVANGDIVIPPYTKMIIRPCSIPSGVAYASIYIPNTSELIFDEADINMIVGTIKVDGRFRMGSPTCRLRSYITITFDTALAHDIGTCGKKGMCISNIGSIDIHGFLYHPTWVRLASSAEIGDDRVYLQEAVNWEVGQEIAILTSSWVGDAEHETRIISAIDPSGKIIQFSPPLDYIHYGGIEYQTEVVLLSRRIILQGDAESEISTQGGHLLSISKETRISGVRAYRMGKTNIIGRYPLHFHMVGSAPNSYFTDNAVVHSFYRCYTVHGTHNVTLANNIAFDAIGHCYYIEDGVEEDNHFLYNLAASIHYIPEYEGVVPQFVGQDGSTVEQNENLHIPADIAAGGFYITNSNNEFIGNAAVGGFAGYSFVNLPTPIGLHRNVSMVPMERPLKYFYGNTIHSSNWQYSQSGCIYIGGKLFFTNESDHLTYISGRIQRNTKDLAGKDAWMLLQHTQTWQCYLGVSHWGERIELIDFEAHDVSRGSQIFGRSWQANALINARSANPTTDRPSKVNGFQYYDTWSFAIVSNTTYKNFGEDDLAWIDMTHSDYFKPQGIASAKNIKYENVVSGNEIAHRPKATGSSRYWNIMDWDGSVSLSPFGAGVPVLIGGTDSEYYNDANGNSILTKEWWRVSDACINRTDWQTWLCPKTDDLEIGYITIVIDGLVGWWDRSLEWLEQKPSTYLGLMSQFGHYGVDRRSTIVTNNPGIGGATGSTGWYFTLTNNVTYLAPQRMIIYATHIPYVAANNFTHIYFAMSYPQGLMFNISVQHAWKTSLNAVLTPASSLTDLALDPLGHKYYYVNDGSQSLLYLKLIQRNDQETKPEAYWFERDGVRDYVTSNQYWYVIETGGGTPSVSWGTESFYTVSESIPGVFPTI